MMDDRLAIIACSPRSGSTLLSRILDSHTCIAAPCEIPLTVFFDPGDPKLPTLREKLARICAYYDVSWPGGEAEPQALFDAIRRKEGKPLVVIKHPRQSIYLSRLATALRPRVIHLTRDVRSTAMTSFYDGDRREGFERWLYIQQRICDALQLLPASQVLQVRYEDLVRVPKRWMVQVVEFLGLDFEPPMLDYGRFEHADEKMQLWEREGPASWAHHRELSRGAVSVQVLRNREAYDGEVTSIYESGPAYRRLNRCLGYDAPAGPTVPGDGRELFYCFVFVCQKGPIEAKALLLAASLARHLKCRHEMVAAVPAPESLWGAPEPETLRTLEKLGARVVSIINPIDHAYPVGNKVSCLSVATTADKIVFLDSDMLCMRSFFHEDRFRIPFAARAAGYLTWGREAGSWERVYRIFGLAVPPERIRAAESGEETPPYFNAGVISVDASAGLGEAWIDTCRAIDADGAIPDKRPWLDQIALPVAVRRLGLATDLLDESYNFPGQIRPVPQDRPPLFFHYHRPAEIAGQPEARRLVRALLDEHPATARAVRADAQWAAVLAEAPTPPSRSLGCVRRLARWVRTT